MGGGGVPSGGVYIVNGRSGDLPTQVVKLNSRYDLYVNGVRIQSRWFDHEGKAARNRDYLHNDSMKSHFFPHDHKWTWVAGRPQRKRDGLNPDYSYFE